MYIRTHDVGALRDAVRSDPFEFYLRRDVVWHDGAPFTAADVAFTVQAMQDPNFQGDPSLGELWRNVTVEQQDNYTVRFTLAEPFPFLDYTTIGLIPKHLLEDVPVAELNQDTFNYQPIGSGLFQVVENADHAVGDRAHDKAVEQCHVAPGAGAGGDAAYIVSDTNHPQAPFFDGLRAWGDTIWQLWEHNKDVDGAAPFLMAQTAVGTPAEPGESIFARGIGSYILRIGIVFAAFSIALMLTIERTGGPWKTMVFTTLCLAQMGNALAIRSDKYSLFSIGVFSNPALVGAVLLTFALQLAVVYVPFIQDLFQTVALSPLELAICLGASTLVFWVVEVVKWIGRRRTRTA